METDKRFAHIVNDPKFRRIPKGERKVKIDKRFQSMFTDKKFKVNYTVDKRGRPIKHTTTEDLRRYYDLDSDEEEESDSDEDKQESNEEESEESSEEKLSEDEDNQGKKPSKKATKQKSEKDTKDKGKSKIKSKVSEEIKDADEDENESEEELKINASDQKLPEKIKKKLKNLTVDYARGEGNLLSEESSSDEEIEEEVDSVEDSIDHKWGELDADADKTDEVTYRLAACNMDWDRIRALDLMVLFNSFLPAGGTIKSVVIYPSEFGKKRLAEEEIKGPAELIQQSGEAEDDDGNEEGSKYHMEKLRQYQLNRLKYYYAVITCDSANSANKIYTECDGMEYESSATKIDLRFIPDDMSFDDDEPKESCDQLPELNKYKPRFFTTTALQQAKVDLTWDETNPERIELTKKLASGKIDDVSESDLQAYLASSSGEESAEETQVKSDDESEEETEETDIQSAIDKYKLLLQEIDAKEKAKKEKDVGMEISWGIDLQKKTDQIIKEKKSSSENKTPFEQFLEKRKEKRKEKRAAKKNQNENSDKEDDDDDIPSDIDMNDPYFAEEFKNPEFKQTKKDKNSKQSKSKNKGGKGHSDSDYDSHEEAEKKAELELLLDDNDGKKHFSLKKIQDEENESKSKKKRKLKKKQQTEDTPDDFSINLNDERFSALFTSHHYNIDPTDPHYKKTKNMNKLVDEKIKRRIEEDNSESSLSKKTKTTGNEAVVKNNDKNAELNVLVKSVKRKAEAFKHKKK